MKYNKDGFAVFEGVIPREAGRFDYQLTESNRLYFISPDNLYVNEMGYSWQSIPAKYEFRSAGWNVSLKHSVYGAEYVGLDAVVADTIDQRILGNRVLWFPIDDNPAPRFLHQLPEKYRAWNKARRADLLPTMIYNKSSLTGADDLGYLSKNFRGHFLGDIIAPSEPVAYAVLDKLHFVKQDGMTCLFRVPIVHMEPDGTFFVSKVVLPASKIKSYFTKKVQSGEFRVVGSWKRNLRSERMRAVVNDLLEKYGF